MGLDGSKYNNDRIFPLVTRQAADFIVELLNDKKTNFYLICDFIQDFTKIKGGERFESLCHYLAKEYNIKLLETLARDAKWKQLEYLLKTF